MNELKLVIWEDAFGCPTCCPETEGVTPLLFE